MSDNSKISWCDATWNCVRGCTKLIQGCRNCFAARFAERWRGVPGHPYEQGFDVRLVPEKLDQPLHWRKPRRIFVNSMSDLFHEKVPFEFINQVWRTMIKCPHHTFQILTKRPRRMLEFFRLVNKMVDFPVLPLVHLGVSVEDQATADERIPLLLQTPAAVRFLSVEPMLAAVDLERYLWLVGASTAGPWTDALGRRRRVGGSSIGGQTISRSPSGDIDWVIVGGESGPGARPMQLEWARSVVAQCKAAGVACFVKQLTNPSRPSHPLKDLADFPEDLRVREFPKAPTR